MELTLYSVDGRKVRTLAEGWRPAGPQRLEWDGLDADGRRAHTGVYYVRLRAAGASATCRLVNLR
jgi:flagellar hook assembly protein FlgD